MHCQHQAKKKNQTKTHPKIIHFALKACLINSEIVNWGEWIISPDCTRAAESQQPPGFTHWWKENRFVHLGSEQTSNWIQLAPQSGVREVNAVFSWIQGASTSQAGLKREIFRISFVSGWDLLQWECVPQTRLKKQVQRACFNLSFTLMKAGESSGGNYYLWD